MIYVAGKIRNLDNYKLLFNAAKKYLNKHDLKHITAVELLERINYTQLSEKVIINEINNIIYDCDTIYILPNYKSSKGTQFEIEIAKYYDKNIVYLEWDNLFDNDFTDDFQKHFNTNFKTRVESEKAYKHLLVSYIYNIINSYTEVGKCIYKTKSNAYSTVVNAVNNVKYVIEGLQGSKLKNEYLYKKELIEKWVEGYYAS